MKNSSFQEWEDYTHRGLFLVLRQLNLVNNPTFRVVYNSEKFIRKTICFQFYNKFPIKY